MTVPAVESAAREQWSAIADALADAFFTDPVLGWLIPDDGRRLAALRRFFAIEARDVVLPHGTSLVAAESAAVIGAALVLPPGRWRTPMGAQIRHGADLARIFGRRIGHAFGLLTALERMHPRDGHYYLPYIGVMASARGGGVGGALLAELARRCDDQGLPAYLEATSPDNARLYRRHGFVTSRRVTPLGSPPIELMTRQPRRP